MPTFKLAAPSLKSNYNPALSAMGIPAANIAGINVPNPAAKKSSTTTSLLIVGAIAAAVYFL